MQDFIKAAGKEYTGFENSLKKLKLIKDEKSTNASVILFGKNPETFFPNAKLRCAVFATNDTSYIIDMQEVTGDIFYLIEEAIREAVVNAFCHRDYYEFDSVNTAIFKNRVEIRNKGRLYGGLTIEQIKSEMVSERRNELIAEILHEIHLIEKWGRGINLILTKEPDTDFREVGTQFIVTFRRKHIEKMRKREAERWSERWSEINENQRRILNLIRENPAISRKEISDNLKINQSAIQKHLETLKKKGILKRVSSARGGYWQLIEE
jgi:ATP-dependent DNA helicase RecG